MLKKLLGPMLIVFAIVLVFMLIKNKPRPETKTEVSKESINLLISKVSPSQHPLLIPAEGFVTSRWRTELSSQVSGQVIEINDKLLVGNLFNQNDTLLKIDPLKYEVELTRAQANLKAAESNLIEQEMQSERAKSDWNKLNPTRQASEFNMRIPQLKTAQSNLLAAKDELRLAQENLNRTQITAPFDGFSLSRNVSLGDLLQTGDVVAEIIDRNNLELELSLTLEQVSLMQEAQNIQIYLNTNANNTINEMTEMKVLKVRFEPFIDSLNRWRTAIFELSNESNKLLLGEFLKVIISMNQNKDMLALPESTLSSDGKIWYVDSTNNTEYFTPNITYKNSGTLYIATETQLTYPLAVVVSPPNSLLRGTKVLNTDSKQPSNTTE